MHADRSDFWSTAAVVFAALLFLGGCQARTYDVTGVVAVKDEPIPLGSITFIGEPPSSAVVDVRVENGRFHSRLVPGDYRLTVAAMQPPAPEPPPPSGMGVPEDTLAEMQKEYDSYKPPKTPRIPRRYADYGSTPLRYTVVPRSQKHDIVIDP